MSYFRPRIYVKQRPSSLRGEGSTSRYKLDFVGQVLSGVLLGGGLLLLLTQFVLPWWQFRWERGLATPIPPDFSVRPVRAEESAEVLLGSFGEKATPEFFYLYIPRLGIHNARVRTESLDFNPREYLGHYLGTVLPGEVGNTFIYGHSAVRLFYNPRNYKTIFSTLPDLRKGDEIVIDYQDRLFSYTVEYIKVLEPEQVDPLASVSPPSLQRSYVTLMTCVPPGLDTKRLLVVARLTAWE